MGTIVIWLLCIAGILGLGGFLWRTSRSTGSDSPFTMPAWLSDRALAGRAWGGARAQAAASPSRLAAWWKSRGDIPVLAAPPAGRPAPAARPGPAPRRPAPAVLADRVLDDAMGRGAVPMAGAIPPDWAALCARVGSFEPETDEHYLEHLSGEAAGAYAYAEAVRAGADVLASETGLDPAVVHAHLEWADIAGECAHGVAMVRRRFSAVYAAVQEAVAAGLRLPYRARQFLTGAGG